MLEFEFRLKKFEEFIPKIQGKRIVLYGTGMNAKKVIEEYPQLQIVGVMEKLVTDPYIFGKKNLNIEDLITLKVDAVVIASQIRNLREIYNRICLFCHANHIAVYDMYGNDLFELFYKLEDHLCSLCQRNAEILQREIDEHDIISIDLFQTVFNAKVGFKERIWWRIAKEYAAFIPSPMEFVDARKRVETKFLQREKNNQLNDIYSEIGGALKLTGEQTDLLLEKEKQYVIQGLIVDDRMIEILGQAKKNGKTIWAMSDLYFSEEEIQKILDKHHISSFDKVISAKDLGCMKHTGFFRIMDGENRKWLHIGEDEIADGLCPLVNGVDIFLLKKADSLRKTSDYYEIFQQIQKWYEGGKVNDIIKYGSDSLYESIARLELLDPFYYCTKEDEEVSDKEKIKRLKKLEFPIYEQPDVSIVIPVYNQFLYTYNCLYSILQNTDKVSYEIIIADDGSTDFTRYINEVVSGVKVVHNKKNLRFLRNCNHAAERASGKYILFLNNDTYVQPRWLRELVTLIEQNEKIGMVGSKLIYPDGRLQEAGGIVWRDASAWNFGYGQVAGAPIYNYVKETDYISGAAIMIRTALWKEIGGFDERYAPAYYEDTDLAFEVRKHGYQVVYNPFSVVVHYEGVSNGTDISSGQKAYQIANKEKFFEKWKDILVKDHFENGKNVFIAKDRSRHKKHILVVDHYVPQHDHDAGGRCTYMYIKAFLRMGMQVTFIGDNFAYSVPYTEELLKMGVEILYGSYYKMHIEEWMQQNLQYFDVVYLQRPHISIKYIDMVKRYGNAKIFYFAHDLHHIRLQRQYELTGDEDALLEAKKWKPIEMELFEKADVGHVVGDFEQKYMQEIYPDKPIRNIPLYIFEDIYKKNTLSFQERKDILYVGGFGHPPNIDAVLWFANEIFPIILKKYPDIKWHVVGNKPTEEIKNLASDNIIVEGFVSDEKLEQLYNSCRMAVVPLRVGAGVKGKIVEASYYQVPVVTTDVGAEGISSEEKALIVENDACKMAEVICSLYEDYDMLAEYAARERKLIEKHYLLKNAMDVLKKDMDK